MDRIDKLVLLNMYDQNAIKPSIIEYITPNKDCIFEMTRYMNQLWYTDSSSKYTCSIVVKNELNIPIFEIRVDEYSILNMMNNICAFISYSEVSTNEEVINRFIRTNYITSTIDEYIINLTKFKNESNNRFNIDQYHNGSYICTRKNLLLSNDDLRDFMFKMYFSFIIDLEISNDIASFEYLFDQILK